MLNMIGIIYGEFLNAIVSMLVLRSSVVYQSKNQLKLNTRVEINFNKSNDIILYGY